jgi:hypothetical protein
METQMQRNTATHVATPPELPGANSLRKPRGAGSQLVGERANERDHVPDRSLRRIPPLDMACQPGDLLRDEMNEATAVVLWATAALSVVLLILTKVWG